MLDRLHWGINQEFTHFSRHIDFHTLFYTQVIAILHKVANPNMIIPKVIRKLLPKWVKTGVIKIELSVTHRMSTGGQLRNMWYAIFSLASLLFIYYIPLILSHFSHPAVSYQSKSFGRPPFWGLILIGNCCKGTLRYERNRRGEKEGETDRETRQADRQRDDNIIY